MIVEAGQIALALAFAASIYSALASAAGVARRSSETLISGRFALYSVPALLLAATAALIYAFVANDFSVRYVAENSSLSMPRAYTWVAFYAGNAGSILYLAAAFSAACVIATVGIRRKLPYTAPYATAIMALVLAFLLGVMPLSRQPSGSDGNRPAGRTGNKPAAGAFRHVYPPAAPDAWACIGGDSVRHRDGRDAGEQGRQR